MFAFCFIFALRGIIVTKRIIIYLKRYIIKTKFKIITIIFVIQVKYDENNQAREFE